jgi:predicted nucleic acid-binding protein
MTDGYLLDTNVISVLANSRHPQHAEFQRKARDLRHVWLPVVAIAEIEFGMAKSTTIDELQRQALHRFFERFPQALPFGSNTVEPYSLLRAQLWQNCATALKRGHKEKLPEDLFDRVSGKQLGIDERDLLIASIAAEHRLILITRDQNAAMRAIDRAGKDLRAKGAPIDLQITYW